MNRKLIQNYKAAPSIPVIDIFAGPGGLGEGFSAYRVAGFEHPFRIRLSIEKDATAHTTLLLRAFFRQLPADRIPAAYYDFLRGASIPFRDGLKRLFDEYPVEASRAESEAWLAELGGEDTSLDDVYQRIEAGLDGAENWVLIGGPPCQAYSLAGRSRNKGIEDYVPEDDEKQYLYVEYLKIIADHQPAIFIMENVKGLLSATLKEQLIFERICSDLQNPVEALRREGHEVRGRPGAWRRRPQRYRLFSVVNYAGREERFSLFPTASEGAGQDLKLNSFVVRMEKHGIPQARHRVIILGIREDLDGVVPRTLKQSGPVPARSVLSGLPRLRSGLSQEADSSLEWVRLLHEMSGNCLLHAAREKGGEELFNRLTTALELIGQEELSRGGEFMACTPSVEYRPDWFFDERLGGVCNHSTRSHITPDLYRYLYAACFAATKSRSPNLRDFPEALLPTYRNVRKALKGNNFSDRFRVQLADRPSTTVTSHIAKDGHYYIHYDPTRRRSLVN